MGHRFVRHGDLTKHMKHVKIPYVLTCASSLKHVKKHFDMKWE